ncbi:MAG: flagellar hook-associated protein 3 FlgL [Solirubrobacteraceae bacterium]|nr:flagellar hook-associated protein 3 FlgL [Solirubrobacteraceae bacterium]
MSTPRITSSMISRSTLADLNDVATRITDTQRKMSTGKQLTRPSDDPFAVGRALGLHTEVDGLVQYQRNSADGESWTAASDTALGTLTDIAQRGRELLVRGANGTATAGERAVVADEIDQLIEAAKQTANSQQGGRSLFAGTATDVKPYAAGSDVYAGDGGDVVRSIGPGVAVVVNVRASDILGSGGGDGKMLSVLRDVSAHLRGGTSADQAALGGGDIAAVDRSIDDLLGARAHIGAVANRLSAADDRLAELEGGARELLSKTEDADMASTLIDYSMQQSVYQSALKAGAGIVQSSLLDFLR